MSEEIKQKDDLILKLNDLISKQREIISQNEKIIESQQKSLAVLAFKTSANTSINIMLFTSLIKLSPDLVVHFSKIITETLECLNTTKKYIPNIYLIGQLSDILKNIQSPSEHPHLKVVEDWNKIH